jgi:hypothetical protein
MWNLEAFVLDIHLCLFFSQVQPNPQTKVLKSISSPDLVPHTFLALKLYSLQISSSKGTHVEFDV